jgi:hypothetical protein
MYSVGLKERHVYAYGRWGPTPSGGPVDTRKLALEFAGENWKSCQAPIVYHSLLPEGLAELIQMMEEGHIQKVEGHEFRQGSKYGNCRYELSVILRHKAKSDRSSMGLAHYPVLV